MTMVVVSDSFGPSVLLSAARSARLNATGIFAAPGVVSQWPEQQPRAPDC